MDATRLILTGLFLTVLWPLIALVAIAHAAWTVLRRRAAARP
jgi:hypothetical protein